MPHSSSSPTTRKSNTHRLFQEHKRKAVQSQSAMHKSRLQMLRSNTNNNKLKTEITEEIPPNTLRLTGTFAALLDGVDISDGLSFSLSSLMNPGGGGGSEQIAEQLQATSKCNRILVAAWFDGRADMGFAHCVKSRLKLGDDAAAGSSDSNVVCADDEGVSEGGGAIVQPPPRDTSLDATFTLDVPIPTPHAPNVLKIASYMDITDDESGLRKYFPLQTCGIKVETLLQGNATAVLTTCHDEFNEHLESVLSVTLADGHPEIDTKKMFTESSILHADKYMECVAGISPKLCADCESGNIYVPLSLRSYLDGVTFAPFVGVPGAGIPPMPMHYALMGACMTGIDRTYPQSYAIYMAMLTFMQSPHDMTTLGCIIVEGPSNPAYVNLIADCVTGFTKDAMIIAYERDGTPSLSASMDPLGTDVKVELSVSTTEEINFVGYTAAMLAECDVDLDKELSGKTPIQVTPNSSVRQCKREFAREQWPEMSRSWGKDDCESSMFTACNLFKTVERGDWSASNLMQKYGDHPVFANFTPRSWAFIGTFFSNWQQRILAGDMDISPVIGVAGGASATDDGDSGDGGKEVKPGGEAQQPTQPAPAASWDPDSMDAGGHCFGVLRFRDAANESMRVRVLEGTNSTLFLQNAAGRPKYRLQVQTSDDGKSMLIPEDPSMLLDTPDEKTKVLEYDTCKFACLLSKMVSTFTQVCVDRATENAIKSLPPSEAEQAMKSELNAGWQCCNGRKHYGMTRTQVVMDAEAPAFYRRALYMGSNLMPGVHGFVPCADFVPADSGTRTFYAGCTAGELGHPKLQGLPVDEAVAPAEIVHNGIACMNEIWPPVASEELHHKVLASWAPLPAMEHVNSKEHNETMRKYLDEGKEYVCVSCCESPNSPLLVDCSYVAKKALVDKANEINADLPNSDGIFLHLQKSGTGNTITMFIPQGAEPVTHVTMLSSLKAARKAVGWTSVI